MHKRDIDSKEDSNFNARLSLAIMLASVLVMVGMMAIVGLLYGFSRMIDKLNF